MTGQNGCWKLPFFVKVLIARINCREENSTQSVSADHWWSLIHPSHDHCPPVTVRAREAAWLSYSILAIDRPRNTELTYSQAKTNSRPFWGRGGTFHSQHTYRSWFQVSTNYAIKIGQTEPTGRGWRRGNSRVQQHKLWYAQVVPLFSMDLKDAKHHAHVHVLQRWITSKRLNSFSPIQAKTYHQYNNMP